MRVLFPSRLFEPREVDPGFAEERAAALAAGLEVDLIDQEALDEGAPRRAVRRVHGEGLAIYRGWMLRAGRYAALYEALEARGIQLVNTPEAYRRCHHLPEGLEWIRDRTPETAWVPLEGGAVGLDEVVEAARAFGPRPLIIKDYVKSRKHEWAEACFIPDAQDAGAVRRVASTFIERQGEWLVGGVVLRAFVPLRPIGRHPQSGAPLTREHRVFVWRGRPLIQTPYWAEGAYSEGAAPLEEIASILPRVQSAFFTVDLAEGMDGRWWIIELGDGQVSGCLTLPPARLYEALSRADGV